MTKNIQTIAFADIRDVFTALDVMDANVIMDIMDAGLHDQLADAKYLLVETDIVRESLWYGLEYVHVQMDRAQYDETFRNVVGDAQFINVNYLTN